MSSPDDLNPRETPTPAGEMLERTRRRIVAIRRRRRAGLVAVAAVVVAAAIAVPLALASHSPGRVVDVSGGPTSTGSIPTTPPRSSTLPTTPSVTPISAPPTSATSPATSSSSAPTSVTQCPTSQLEVSLGNPDGTAGSTVYELIFTNAGASTCTLQGYPGVSYVSSAGAMVGAPANRNPTQPPVSVTLAPGHSAFALLEEVDPLNYPSTSCQLTAVKGLRVYPPDQTASLVTPQDTQVCANPADTGMQIQAIRA